MILAILFRSCGLLPPTAVGRVWIKWDKGGEFRQIFIFLYFYLLSKGYTCHFKSEAFASFASIALRPWLPTTFKFYGFPIFCLWMYLMKVILDTCACALNLIYPWVCTGKQQNSNLPLNLISPWMCTGKQQNSNFAWKLNRTLAR